MEWFRRRPTRSHYSSNVYFGGNLVTSPITFNCLGNGAHVVTVTLGSPPSSSHFQVLLSNIGSTSGLLGNNFTVVIGMQNATAFTIAANVYGIYCPSLTYNVRSIIIYPQESARFIAVNNIPVSSASGLIVQMPRATTTASPSVYPFINSVVTNSGAKFSVNATLVNTTHVHLFANRFDGCITLYVSYLVIEAANDTVYWHAALIQMTTSLSIPTYDSSHWTDFIIGLVTYNVFSDFNWACSTSPLSCTTLSNQMELNVVFIANATCTSNSVINFFSFTISPTCTCSLGHWANFNTCSSCHYSCNDCQAGTSGDCLACDPLLMRQLVGATCSCVFGYYDSGVPLCSSCNSSLHCLACNTTTTCISCDPNTFRSLSIALTCDCISGYYSTGVGVCAQCQYMCATCSNSSVCRSCLLGANRNTSDIHFCSCLSGFYSSGTLACLTCSAECQTCISAASNCSSCNISHFRTLVGTSCPCATGYYNNTATYPVCMKCPADCSACTSLTFCTACSVGFTLNGGVCSMTSVPVVLNITMNVIQQTLNSLIVQIGLSTKVIFSTGLTNILSLWNGDISIPYTVVSVSNRTDPTTVKVLFNLTQGLQNVTIVFTNNSMVTSNGTQAVSERSTAQLPNYYLFSNQ